MKSALRQSGQRRKSASRSYARKMKVSFREAALFLGEKDPGPNSNEPKSVVELAPSVGESIAAS